MQDESLLSFMMSQNILKMILLFPVLQNLRFFPVQIPPHLKIRNRHMKRIFIIRRHVPVLPFLFNKKASCLRTPLRGTTLIHPPFRSDTLIHALTPHLRMLTR